MIRLTERYLWQFLFSLAFLAIMFLATVILSSESHREFSELTIVDFLLITLATWRLTRLLVYDTISSFIREQFADVVKEGEGYALVKPRSGPRRTLYELFHCPWCCGVWAALLISFFYLLTPLAFVPVLILAIAAVAAFLQLLANLVGWQAEKVRREVER
jgi:hypothetical protein